MQHSSDRPLVFLDTNVVAAYLRGESPSSHIFSHEVLEKVRLAINPIVFQELFFLAETRKHPEIVQQQPQWTCVLQQLLFRGIVLLTRNVSDFSKLPNLTTEDWTI